MATDRSHSPDERIDALFKQQADTHEQLAQWIRNVGTWQADIVARLRRFVLLLVIGAAMMLAGAVVVAIINHRITVVSCRAVNENRQFANNRQQLNVRNLTADIALLEASRADAEAQHVDPKRLEPLNESIRAKQAIVSSDISLPLLSC